MELRQYLAVLLNWWWLIALSTAVAVVSSYLTVGQQPPVYTAKATLMVGRTLESPNPNSADMSTSLQLAQTYAEIAKRQPIRRATMDALGVETLPEYTVSLVPQTQLLEIRVVSTIPALAQAVANELSRQLIELSPAEDPRIASRRDYIKGRLDKIEVTIDETEQEIKELLEAMDTMFSARQIADTQAKVGALYQKLSTLEQTYSGGFNLILGSSPNTIDVIEPADTAWIVGPGKSSTIALAAAIGFLLAVAGAFLLEYLDDTIKVGEDVQDTLHLTNLAMLLRVEGKQSEQKLVTMLNPQSPQAEAFRVLRTNLQFAAVDRPLRTLMVTSAGPEEGKTTTLANLAITMAQQGQRVVLVDGDMRRPKQHRLFKLRSTPGLANALLQDNSPVDDFLQATRQENLWLLASGSIPPNPGELLGSGRFNALLGQLQEQADVVLLDCAPTLVVADAAILARQVDGVLLVCDYGTTRRRSAVTAKETLDKVGARIVGTAINRVQPKASGYHSYKYYDRREGAAEYGDASATARRGVPAWLSSRFGRTASRQTR